MEIVNVSWHLLQFLSFSVVQVYSLSDSYCFAPMFAGSSTACIVVLDRRSHRLHTCNLGDSGFLVVRRGEVVHRSDEQQHYFNTPFQLSIAPPGAEGVVLSDRSVTRCWKTEEQGMTGLQAEPHHCMVIITSLITNMVVFLYQPSGKYLQMLFTLLFRLLNGKVAQSKHFSFNTCTHFQDVTEIWTVCATFSADVLLHQVMWFCGSE